MAICGHQRPSEAISGHQWPSVAIRGREWQPRVTQRSTSRTALKHCMHCKVRHACNQRSSSRTALKHAKLCVSSFAEGKSPSSIILGAHLMREAISMQSSLDHPWGAPDEGGHRCPSVPISARRGSVRARSQSRSRSQVSELDPHLRLRSSLVYIVKWFVLLFPTMRRRCGSASGGRPRAHRHAVRAAFLSGSGHSTHSDVASGAAGSDSHVTPQ